MVSLENFTTVSETWRQTHVRLIGFPMSLSKPYMPNSSLHTAEGAPALLIVCIYVGEIFLYSTNYCVNKTVTMTHTDSPL